MTKAYLISFWDVLISYQEACLHDYVWLFIRLWTYTDVQSVSNFVLHWNNFFIVSKNIFNYLWSIFWYAM